MEAAAAPVDATPAGAPASAAVFGCTESRSVSHALARADCVSDRVAIALGDACGYALSEPVVDLEVSAVDVIPAGETEGDAPLERVAVGVGVGVLVGDGVAEAVAGAVREGTSDADRAAVCAADEVARVEVDASAETVHCCVCSGDAVGPALSDCAPDSIALSVGATDALDSNEASADGDVAKLGDGGEE